MDRRLPIKKGTRPDNHLHHMAVSLHVLIYHLSDVVPLHQIDFFPRKKFQRVKRIRRISDIGLHCGTQKRICLVFQAVAVTLLFQQESFIKIRDDRKLLFHPFPVKLRGPEKRSHVMVMYPSLLI